MGEMGLTSSFRTLGDAGSKSIAAGTVCSLMDMKSSSVLFGAFLRLARLKMNIMARASIITSKMPMTIPAMAPPDIFWLFEFLDREDVRFGCKPGLKPSAGQGWPGRSW